MDIKQQKNELILDVRLEGIIYSVNKTNMTASIIGNYSEDERIIIPRSINYELNEYIVTSISEGAFKKSKHRILEFAPNSEVRKISKKAFKKSMIHYLTIPSSLIELEDGWCEKANFLSQINVSPNNPRYSTYDENKLIIGKSSLENENYDVLVFCIRDAHEVKIPDFIEIISPYALSECNLTRVDISNDSKLRIIGKFAFAYTKIKSFKIPQHVKIISESLFSFCIDLSQFEFSDDSDLEIIEKNAFFKTSIKSISIPSGLIDLKDGWCTSTSKLCEIIINPKNPRYACFEEKIIIGKSSIDQENYDTLVFGTRDISIGNIPSFIKIIKFHAFEKCIKLKKVDISENSQLQIIENEAFCETSIEKFFLPPKVTKIFEGAFYHCINLKNFYVPINSELRIIEKNVFSHSPIEMLSIPSNTELQEGWCSFTSKLFNLQFIEGNKHYKIISNKIIVGKSFDGSNNYNVLIFAARDIETAIIPDYIEIIGSYAFQECSKLKNIQISSNSKLRIIENYAFANSSIEKFIVPSSLVNIGERAFYSCFLLREFVIPYNSNLQILGNDSFTYSSIESIVISPHIKIIGNRAFNNCKQLKKVDIPSSSELEIIGSNAFSSSDISEIYIPSHLIKIGDGAFTNCLKLKKVDIPEISDLQMIGKLSFQNTPIRYLYIPIHVKLIDDRAFEKCNKLRYVEISSNSELQQINKFAFSSSSIAKIFIPDQLKKLCFGAFNKCHELNGIVFTPNSEIQTISNLALDFIGIKSLYIPPQLKNIPEDFLFGMNSLQIIEISENSILDNIDQKFTNTRRHGILIMIPCKSHDKF